MPLQQTDKCCLCSKTFDQNNFPRMMPSCDHSVCTNCLKTLFKNGTKLIICSYCKNQQEILQTDLEYFPKNISLIKLIKDSTLRKIQNTSQLSTPTKLPHSSYNASLSSNKKLQSSSISSDFVQSDSSLISQPNSQHHYSTNQINNKNICQTHQKQMEIICLTDFTRLCPLCAVFGTHKDHQLKTIDQTTKILNDTLKQFQEMKHSKKSLQTKIKNPQFKTQIVEKIAHVKNRLTKQIKQKFTAIKQAITIAEKNANDDLTKRFREVNDRINKMVKEQSQFQTYWGNWARTVELQLAETIKVGIGFQQKAQVYFGGLIGGMKEGRFYLSRLESYTKEKRERLEAVPELVTIVYGENLVKDIYNFVSLRLEEGEGMMTDSRVEENALRMEMEGMGIRAESNNVQKQGSFGGLTGKMSSMPSMQESQTSTMTKKPIQVEFSSSQNFLSPAKDRFLSPPSTMNLQQKRKSPRQKSRSLPKQTQQINIPKPFTSPQKPQLHPSTNQISQQRKKYLSATSEGIVQMFIADDKLQTLDLCSFDMPDNEIILVLDYVFNKKKVKCLKLSQNKLSNEGFGYVLSFLKFTTNLNLSSNLLTEEVLNVLIRNKEKVPNLRILNLANNRVNERKAKVYVDELKKQGIIVTL